MSAAVVVLLGWDATRRALVQALRAQAVDVAVAVVSSKTVAPELLGPMRDAPENFWVIDPEHVERDLARMQSRYQGPEDSGVEHRA